MSKYYYKSEETGAMFGLGKCGELMTINLNGDISQELAMLRGIDYGRKHHNDMPDALRYCVSDAVVTTKMNQLMQKCIVKVIFNDPATIVFLG